jgi:hypothetical protein
MDTSLPRQRGFKSKIHAPSGTAIDLLQLDFLPAVNGGDSFYAAHGDASAIGWVGAS